MGEATKISWAHDSWNFWIGCTKVSQGCKLCYAEAQNRRFNWNPAGWGPGAPRRLTSEANQKKPMAWARRAIKENELRRVFAGSLCDPLDAEVPEQWRNRYYNLIDDVGEYCRFHRETPGAGIEFLILTKRIEHAWKMLPLEWQKYPPDCVRLGVTVENQENARRIDAMLRVWRGKNFVSVEPMLGPITLPHLQSIDWVIVGGESGPGCRPMQVDWALDVKRQCARTTTPFFFKQLGGHPNKQDDPDKWPSALQCQQFPKN